MGNLGVDSSDKPATHQRSLLVACPYCKETGSLSAWPRIERSTDAHATALLLQGNLFKYTCPACQRTTSMVYNSLYHDEKRRAVMLFSTSKCETANIATLTEARERLERENPSAGYSKNDAPVAGTPSFRFDRYQERLVTRPFEFFEKARIWNAGYDDRVIELLKVAIKRGMLKEGIIGANDTLIYERTMPDGGISFVVVGEIPGDTVGVPQGYDYCRTYLEEGEMQGILAREFRFDHAWAKRFLP